MISPLLALFGHGAMSDLSPLSGAKRKLDVGAFRAAFDPQRHFATFAALRKIIEVAPRTNGNGFAWPPHWVHNRWLSAIPRGRGE
jgi:hypothetical protein